MNQDRNIQVNWGTFNVPTIAGMFAVFAAVWSLSGHLERLDARLDTIEQSRANKAAEFNEQIKTINTAIAQIPNLTYRLTVAEQGIVSVNARVDRMADALADLRDGIGKINTSLEVLTQKMDLAFPPALPGSAKQR